MSAARSIRQNNWPNIKAVAKNKWVGKERHQKGDDRRFERFASAEHGVRAAAMLVQTYVDRREADTVAKILAIWAPSGAENPNHTAYVDYVADALGVDQDETIDVYQWEVMRPLLVAICEFEQGRKNLPAGYERTVEAGIVMAGILPPTKPITQSRTVAGVAGLATGGIGGGAGLVATALGTISGDAPWFVVAGVVVLTLAGAALVLFAYLDDRARLRRSPT
jgi:hypothetical protein